MNTTQWEVIRRLAEAMETKDELSEAMRQAIIALTIVEDARAGSEQTEPIPEPPDEVKEAAEESVEEADAKRKTPGPKKGTKPKGQKPIDDGRIRALWEGGWSVAKIADDMQLSAPTVRKHMQKMGLK